MKWRQGVFLFGIWGWNSLGERMDAWLGPENCLNRGLITGWPLVNLHHRPSGQVQTPCMCVLV